MQVSFNKSSCLFDLIACRCDPWKVWMQKATVPLLILNLVFMQFKLQSCFDIHLVETFDILVLTAIPQEEARSAIESGKQVAEVETMVDP